MKRCLFFTCLFFIISVSVCNADIYRYKDDKGTDWFVDNIDAVPQQYRGQLKGVIKSAAYVPPQKSTRRKNAVGPRKVEIFVTESCPYCTQLEEHLKAAKVKYKKLDIIKSKEAGKEYKKIKGRGVPILRYGKKIIRGYNKAEIDKVLKI